MSADEMQRNHTFAELVKLNNKLDQQLEEFGNGQNASDHPSSQSFPWKKLVAGLLMGLVWIVVPFVVLVRTSVYTYETYRFNGWLALSMGIVATILLLMGYSLYISYRYRNRIRIHKYIVRGIVILVVAYTLYGVLYYSSLNTKTDQIRSYYRSLHPIMRVALATITVADSNVLVTDIRRQPGEYTRMGLPINRQSLHYMQSDGYIHAVDIRTKGRAEWKNWLTRAAFYLSGIETQRHVGTADHLHVYLPLNP